MNRTNYQHRLARLRGEVSAMADLAIERYDTAVDVLTSGDHTRAKAVIDGDQELNDWYLDIEQECIELIALQQPVASDLRFIASSFKIVTDLERIGDLATNLAAYGVESDGTVPETVAVTPLASTAGRMVEDAMEAYTKQDSDLARTVAERDDTLDRDCRYASEQIVRELVTTRTNEEMAKLEPSDSTNGIDRAGTDEQIEQVSRALLTIRDLERVGDHAVNICARTVYLLDNDTELIY